MKQSDTNYEFLFYEALVCKKNVLCFDTEKILKNSLIFLFSGWFIRVIFEVLNDIFFCFKTFSYTKESVKK